MNKSVQVYLEERLPHYLEVLKSMVAINSYTRNSEGVAELSRRTAEVFSHLGFSAEYIPSADANCGPHLFLTRGRPENVGLLLVSHLDTVFPKDEELRNDFQWRVEGERAYGPGTIDNKGGTLAILLLLESLKFQNPEVFEKTSWMIALNAAEEIGAKDFPRLCREKAPAKTRAALVFEAGRMEGSRFSVVAARKGRGSFRIDVEGRGAHAGSAHEYGANAVRQIARIVEAIESQTDHPRHFTVSVGVIGGGDTSNRVPHHAWAEGEYRAFDPLLLKGFQDWLFRLEGNASVHSLADGYSCKVRVSLSEVTDPLPENEATNALIESWEWAAQDLGYSILKEKRGGLSDANLLCGSFSSLDGLGPAGNNAHSSERSGDGSKDQEFLFVNSLIPKTRLNLAALLHLLGEKLSGEIVS